MKYQGADIKRLIPQRFPFIMVNSIEECGTDSAATTLTIRSDNYFMLTDGTMAETGLIEHMAQSCSALAGCQALSKEQEKPPVGIIGEVKHFVCHRRPKLGECVHTVVNFYMSFGQITMAKGISSIGEEQIAEIDLKIFIQ